MYVIISQVGNLEVDQEMDMDPLNNIELSPQGKNW